MDDLIESARARFARLVASRVAGMTDLATAERIVCDELDRLLRELGTSEMLDFDALDLIDDDAFLRLAELDRPDDSGSED